MGKYYRFKPLPVYGQRLFLENRSTIIWKAALLLLLMLFGICTIFTTQRIRKHHRRLTELGKMFAETGDNIEIDYEGQAYHAQIVESQVSLKPCELRAQYLVNGRPHEVPFPVDKKWCFFKGHSMESMEIKPKLAVGDRIEVQYGGKWLNAIVVQPAEDLLDVEVQIQYLKNGKGWGNSFPVDRKWCQKLTSNQTPIQALHASVEKARETPKPTEEPHAMNSSTNQKSASTQEGKSKSQEPALQNIFEIDQEEIAKVLADPSKLDVADIVKLLQNLSQKHVKAA